MSGDDDEFEAVSLETNDTAGRWNWSTGTLLPWAMVVVMLAMTGRAAGTPVEVMGQTLRDCSTATWTPDQRISGRQVKDGAIGSPAAQVSDRTIWIFLIAFAVASSGAVWVLYVRFGMEREAVREVDKASEQAMKAEGGGEMGRARRRGLGELGGLG